MQWANAKSVKNLGGLTARLDVLVSGSLAWTYTWSRYEVLPLFHHFMAFFVPGLMIDLGGILQISGLLRSISSFEKSTKVFVFETGWAM